MPSSLLPQGWVPTPAWKILEIFHIHSLLWYFFHTLLSEAAITCMGMNLCHLEIRCYSRSTSGLVLHAGPQVAPSRRQSKCLCSSPWMDSGWATVQQQKAHSSSPARAESQARWKGSMSAACLWSLVAGGRRWWQGCPTSHFLHLGDPCWYGSLNGSFSHLGNEPALWKCTDWLLGSSSSASETLTGWVAPKMYTSNTVITVNIRYFFLKKMICFLCPMQKISA